jgi:chromosomal replication initiator protein
MSTDLSSCQDFHRAILPPVTAPLSDDEVWKTALGEIELVVSRANFTTWFKNTALQRREEGAVTVSAPNIFTREWLENKYHTVILDALRRADASVRTVRYEVTKHIGATARPIGGSTVTITKKAPPLVRDVVPAGDAVDVYDEASNLNARYTFETFVVGANSELAYAACQAVARQPGATYNPLFIYGGVGLGKTHLLQATGNAVARKLGKRVTYLTSEKFMQEMISAISQRVTQEFKLKYRAVDVLIIDDIQFLAGKEKTQEEFFHTFNELYGINKQIIISSDRPPKAIPTLEERLRSRFEGGMIADIGAPDLETRVAILEAKCAQRGMAIPREVLQHIATHIASNIRELEGALNRVVASNELSGTPVTLESSKSVLASVFEHPKRRAIHFEKIIEAVGGYYHVPTDDMVGKCRRKDIVRPRQIAMYLLRKDNGSSFPSIGTSLGGRDHTTAMHACEKIERELEQDEVLRQDLTLIRQKLYV